MSLPKRKDLTIYKGGTFLEVVSVTDANEVAVSLSGYSVFAELRQYPGDPNSYDLAPEITSAASGEITIEVTDEDTDAFEEGRYEWDMIIENGDGERVVLLKGVATVKGLATQP